MNTPWGPAQYSRHIAPGIVFYDTASHGGIHVSETLLAEMPEYLRLEGGWYEEDSAWSLVAICFPNAFKAEYDQALHTFRNWRPADYERYFGVTLKPGESFVRDRDQFDEANKHNLVVTAAWGDWHAQVPAGMVGVFATLGGSRDPGRDTTRDSYYLVPAAAYKARGSQSFVIDPARHEACAPIQ